VTARDARPLVARVPVLHAPFQGRNAALALTIAGVELVRLGRAGGFAAVLGAVAAETRATGGRVLTVVGCGGDRDPTKRGQMGRVAAECFDVFVVTDDNPREEDSAAIRAAVLVGAHGVSGVVVEEVADRRPAIARAVALEGPADRVVISGRGDESVQVRAGGRRLPRDDRAVVRDLCHAWPRDPVGAPIVADADLHRHEIVPHVQGN